MSIGSFCPINRCIFVPILGGIKEKLGAIMYQKGNKSYALHVCSVV